MPVNEAKRSTSTLKRLAHQCITKNRSNTIDFKFFRNIISNLKITECSGFNTNMAREQGQTLNPATKAVFRSLINNIPSDPNTMMAAMVKVKKLAMQTGQDYTVLLLISNYIELW